MAEIMYIVLLSQNIFTLYFGKICHLNNTYLYIGLKYIIVITKSSLIKLSYID